MIYLILGRCGVGKTTLAKELEKEYKFNVVDDKRVKKIENVDAIITSPDKIYDILDKYENIPFNLVYITANDYQSRLDFYIAKAKNPEKAKAKFEKLCKEEDNLYKDFEKQIKKSKPIRPNVKMLYGFDNNFNMQNIKVNANTLYYHKNLFDNITRTVDIMIDENIINTNQDGLIQLKFPNKEELVTSKELTSYLLSDNNMFSQHMKSFLASRNKDFFK